MNSLRRTVPLALALVSGLFTCVLFVQYRLGQGAEGTAAAASQVPMVVAGAPLSETRPLGERDLRVALVAARPEGAFASAEELKGRLPLVPIPQGQPILSSHLAPLGAQADLWHRVTPGKRAITVAINEVVGVGGFLRIGVRVDIIQVTTLAQGGGQARTIVQNVPVLAVAQDDTRKGEAKARLATSATLLVSPQQAEAISQASETGRIRLVLRAPDDQAVLPLRPLPSSPRSAPAPAAEPLAPARPPVSGTAQARVAAVAQPRAAQGVEVISGQNSEVVQP